jgi:tetratricopeptide (TPR) repeat protein
MSEELSEQDVDRESYTVMDLIKANKFEEALDLCRHHIDHWPTAEKHHAFGWLASVHSRMKNNAAAMEAVTAAIALGPAWSGHWDKRMLLATDMSNFPMAIDDATKLIALERQRGSIAFVESAHVYRAYALIQIGRIEEALSDLSTVQDQGPFRIAGRWWLKSELLEEARKLNS